MPLPLAPAIDAPTGAPDGGTVVPLMSLEDKQRFLAARRTLSGIRRVASSRGVDPQDHEDIVQQTCALAWRARLPADPAGARRVVNRIAVGVACDHLSEEIPKAAPRFEETEDPEDDAGELASQAPDPAYDAAVRQQVQLLMEQGRARFPNRFDAFLAAALDGVPAKDEAERRGVTESHVRKERSVIRAFLAEHGQKIGIVLVAALVLLVIGSMSDWGRRPYGIRPDDGSLWTPRVHHAPQPAADTASLRVRAAEAYRDGNYQAFLDDLDAAEALDGSADTVEEAQQRMNAEHALRMEPPSESK